MEHEIESEQVEPENTLVEQETNENTVKLLL